MTMTGIFQIGLAQSANEQRFVSAMTNSVFELLQPTRTTSGFSHTLLKTREVLHRYVWIAEVKLVTDVPYDFAQNIDRVQKAIAEFGVLVSVEAYTNLAEG